MSYNQIILYIYIIILIIASLLALILYKKDKKMALKNTEVRIKEKYLLAVAIYGGAIGAFLGRIMFKHKTNKNYFSITIYLSLLLQLAVLVLLIITTVRG